MPACELGRRIPSTHQLKSTLVQKRPRIPNWPINAKARPATISPAIATIIEERMERPRGQRRCQRKKQEQP